MSALSPVRRFYKEATARAVDGGFGVALDERALRTPRGKPFVAPTQTLAEAIASEWQAQGEHIAAASMPLTQLAFAALDGGAEARADRIAFIAKYGETDLCCHRAPSPAGLVARQAAAWDPLVAWGAEALGVRLPVVTGVVAAGVSEAVLDQLRACAEALDDFRLTALAHATGLSGSVLIGFALLNERLDGTGAFAAASLDEHWSIEHWGEDEEARARLDRLRGGLEATARFVSALG